MSEVDKNLFKMSIFNSDGAKGLNCGNGLRCVAAFLHQEKKMGNSFDIDTDRGTKQIKL